MECIGLRYFNVFGNRQDPNGVYAAVIPKFINLIKNEKQPIINGDGTFTRDFTYIENVVQANYLAMMTDNKNCFGEIFNIGCGGNYSLNYLVKLINENFNKNIEPIYSSVRDGDVAHSNANIDKAINMLKYNPFVNFEEGIKKLIEIEKNKNVLHHL
jgi:UDP-N-acetylglucosamine 4-epimerase